MTDVSFSFAHHVFRPLACGALHWPARSALLVADLHLEKASWYAAHSQPLPPYDSRDTARSLADAVALSGATEVWCLGDSFHDRDGPERLDPVAAGLLHEVMANRRWTWITGNHDDDRAGILGGVVEAEAEIDGLVLRHEADPDDSRPEISGHFHPKLRLTLRGRRISRRCFALGETKLILPAYGALTGGLEVGEPPIARLLGRGARALVRTEERLLGFPLR